MSFLYFLSIVLLLRATNSTLAEPPSSAAVLVETRNNKALHYVLKRADEYLPPHFSIVLITNKFVASIFRSTCHRNVTIKVLLNATLDRHGYNRLLQSRSLYTDTLEAYDRLLFFQTDTVFCRPFHEWMNEWSREDDDDIDVGYVGAVWHESVLSNKKGFACAALRDQSLAKAYVRVGNGGFSYRSKKIMLEVLDRWNENSDPHANEDVLFACGSHYLEALATEDAANRFCIESVPFDEEMATFSSYMGTPFGVHKPWKYQSVENLKRLMQACPPLQGLIDAQEEKNIVVDMVADDEGMRRLESSL